MVDIETIQTRLANISCPICKKSRFFVNPSRSVGYAEQFHSARCLDCAYSFQVSIPTKPITQTQPDTGMWLASLPCPVCEKIGAEIDFRCTPSVRECFYFV